MTSRPALAAFAVTATLVAASAASAGVVRQFEWDGGNQNPAGGSIDSIVSTFDENTGQFTWSTTFGADGAETDGFWLVVSPGANPKGHAGELAILYMDVTGDSPTLTSYAYNGLNGPTSWFDGAPASNIQDPDRIASSLVDTDWINSLSLEEHGDGSRTLALDIDGGRLNDHVPATPGPDGPAEWTGVAYGETVGIWFHPVTGLDSGYGEDGWLSQWDFQDQGWLDGANFTTTVVPGPGALALFGLAGFAGRRRRRA